VATDSNTMSFLNNLKKVFHLGSGEAKKKRLYNNIRMDTDPADFWDMIGELGDGAFGKVYKAQNKETNRLAAAKMCTLEDEENLSDHMVEIDILSEIRHHNIVELYEAFSIDDKLWVSLESIFLSLISFELTRLVLLIFFRC
jgi:STE20-like kinase